MILRNLMASEPSTVKEILAGLRSPLWEPIRTASISSDDYDVEINDDCTIYKMVVPGRDEDAIDIEVVNTNLVVSTLPTDWLPAQKFTFGMPPNSASIKADLADGVLIITVEHAKPTQPKGKIGISKRK